MKQFFGFLIPILMVSAALVSTPNSSFAASAAAKKIDSEATKALVDLYAKNPKAKELGKKAKGILIFPRIVKAGFVAAGLYGDGVLRKNGKTVDFYNIVAASWGLQAGIQKFSYAIFFMTEPSLKYLNKSKGWEIGGAPSLVVVDKGISRSLSTTTLQNAIYVYFFGQKGLMAGLGLQGTKITKIDPKTLK
jgi:lipid-binding SYLF domain-containing protein